MAPVTVTLRSPFQFTPLREGRLLPPRPTATTHYFNSRPCGRGDSSAITVIEIANRFQFTPLREGRPARPCLGASTSNFNSRPCGRGDSIKRKLSVLIHISIHAPAGGATLKGAKLEASRSISIHAPAGGATGAQNQHQHPNPFQFTPLREGRLGIRGNVQKLKRISIHAPAGGATVGSAIDVGDGSISIHAPAGGATKRAIERFIRRKISIHAPAGGATMSMQPRICLSIYFNSRPCGRGD